MERILSGLGCFGLTLLAIMFVLGVTESIKYVGPIERTLVLTAAVLAAGAVAYLRDRIKNPGPAPSKSERKDQPSRATQTAVTVPAPDPPIHEAILPHATGTLSALPQD